MIRLFAAVAVPPELGEGLKARQNGLAGANWRPPEAFHITLRFFGEVREDVADDLTTTEFTMAMLACRGWTNAEIARHMGVSPGTVKNRLSGVYAKLGIGTRAELVAHMLR